MIGPGLGASFFGPLGRQASLFSSSRMPAYAFHSSHHLQCSASELHCAAPNQCIVPIVGSFLACVWIDWHKNCPCVSPRLLQSIIWLYTPHKRLARLLCTSPAFISRGAANGVEIHRHVACDIKVHWAKNQPGADQIVVLSLLKRHTGFLCLNDCFSLLAALGNASSNLFLNIAVHHVGITLAQRAHLRSNRPQQPFLHSNVHAAPDYLLSTYATHSNASDMVAVICWGLHTSCETPGARCCLWRNAIVQTLRAWAALDVTAHIGIAFREPRRGVHHCSIQKDIISTTVSLLCGSAVLHGSTYDRSEPVTQS